MAARRLTCVFVPGQAGVLAVITTGSTVCGFGTFTFGLVRDFRATVYAAACPPSSTAISVNRAAAAGQLSAVACVANPGYIVVCSYISPAMASRKLAALPATNPASTASAAKCSCSSTLGGTAEQLGHRDVVGTDRDVVGTHRDVVGTGRRHGSGRHEEYQSPHSDHG